MQSVDADHAHLDDDEKKQMAAVPTRKRKASVAYRHFTALECGLLLEYASSHLRGSGTSVDWSDLAQYWQAKAEEGRVNFRTTQALKQKYKLIKKKRKINPSSRPPSTSPLQSPRASSSSSASSSSAATHMLPNSGHVMAGFVAPSPIVRASALPYSHQPVLVQPSLSPQRPQPQGQPPQSSCAAASSSSSAAAVAASSSSSAAAVSSSSHHPDTSHSESTISLVMSSSVAAPSSPSVVSPSHTIAAAPSSSAAAPSASHQSLSSLSPVMQSSPVVSTIASRLTYTSVQQRLANLADEIMERVPRTYTMVTAVTRQVRRAIMVDGKQMVYRSEKKTWTEFESGPFDFKTQKQNTQKKKKKKKRITKNNKKT